MIFYFTGTLNSLDIAKRMLEDDEKLINIAECIKNNEYTFELKHKEKLGFIFPVYFYNIPKIVKDFISKLEVKNVTYTYSIITCGGSIAQSGNVLAEELKKKEIKLNYVSELLMPDNAVIYYAIDSQNKNNELLNTSYKKLEFIKDDIKNNKESKFGRTFISKLVGSMYDLSLSTKKFYALNDLCTGCGLCERICPIEVIQLKDNRPVWTNEKCIKCLACINRCPNKAIQYGGLTKKRHRYVNPNV